MSDVFFCDGREYHARRYHPQAVHELALLYELHSLQGNGRVSSVCVRPGSNACAGDWVMPAVFTRHVLDGHV